MKSYHFFNRTTAVSGVVFPLLVGHDGIPAEFKLQQQQRILVAFLNTSIIYNSHRYSIIIIVAIGPCRHLP